MNEADPAVASIFKSFQNYGVEDKQCEGRYYFPLMRNRALHCLVNEDPA